MKGFNFGYYLADFLRVIFHRRQIVKILGDKEFSAGYQAQQTGDSYADANEQDEVHIRVKTVDHFQEEAHAQEGGE